jgi:hypothetical protein
MKKRPGFIGCLICGGPGRVTAGLCRACGRDARNDISMIERHGLRTCEFSECLRLGEYAIKGAPGHWCWPHKRQIKNGQPLSPVSQPIYRNTICTYPGCGSESMHTFPICRQHKRVSGRYGLSVEELVSLIHESDVCQACGNAGELYIDHDHSCCDVAYGSCGKCVRGLLCRGCNFAAGFAKDNPQRLEAIAGYLRRFRRSS